MRPRRRSGWCQVEQVNCDATRFKTHSDQWNLDRIGARDPVPVLRQLLATDHSCGAGCRSDCETLAERIHRRLPWRTVVLGSLCRVPLGNLSCTPATLHTRRYCWHLRTSSSLSRDAGGLTLRRIRSSRRSRTSCHDSKTTVRLASGSQNSTHSRNIGIELVSGGMDTVP